MDELIKLVRTYRVTTGLAEQQRIGESIYHRVSSELKYAVFSSITHPAADDVLQEIMKAIITSLSKFSGNSHSEFWAWCHRIANNKISDHLRRKYNDKALLMAPEQLWELADTEDATLSPADRLELREAMQLLIKSKPECYEYLWKHFVFGFDYSEIAEERGLSYDGVRMKIGRCLSDAQSLVA